MFVFFFPFIMTDKTVTSHTASPPISFTEDNQFNSICLTTTISTTISVITGTSLIQLNIIGSICQHTFVHLIRMQVVY